jgi:hypothetical protein
MKETIQSFDVAVYSKNQNFKCVNQSKPNKKAVQSAIINNDLRKHLITCYFNDDILDLPKFDIINDVKQEEIKLKLKLMKSKKAFDLGMLPHLEKLDINLSADIETYTPIQLLALLPMSNEFDHQYTHLVGRFCFYNDISFDQFFSWYQSKNGSKEAYDKWTYHWSKMSCFPIVQKSTILTILSRYYPTIKKSMKCINFDDLLNIPKNKIEIRNELNQDVFYTEEKFIILNTAMGSGKTYQTIEYLKDKNNFIWMTPIIALAQNTKFRLDENQIQCHYYKDKCKTKKMDEHDNIIICINSLEKTCEKKYKYVIIDEIETLLHKWFNNNTLNKSNHVDKLATWNRFLEHIMAYQPCLNYVV